MIGKITLGWQLLRNMGLRYVSYRVWYEIERRMGWMKRAYPVDPPPRQFVGLEEWRRERPPFFFSGREALSFPKRPSEALQKKVEHFRAGRLRFFQAEWLDIGRDYDWLTNPATGHRYDAGRHWTEIADFSPVAGDIKYTWEKSRFTFLYDLIRYDYHFGEDQAETVFAEIDSWIAANPVNRGPNYRCSQEISLRILNWTFALYYYAQSPALTEERFQRLLHVIYWQLKHVRANIHFSRIAVRNNHAITETLMLYLSGLLFPFFPEAARWKRSGKRWLEEEVRFQIYKDGAYLQFSHNYHRVVVQLLTWAFGLAERHGEQFTPRIYERARRSLNFLYQHQVPENGRLPNYGSNDGALFFPWNDCEYRDFRPQLNALAYFFRREHLYAEGPWREDVDWLALPPSTQVREGVELQRKDLAVFDSGGFYALRDRDSLSCVRCGKHRTRPAQADNLHLDLWYQGRNILRDAGTYRYNTDPEWVAYFNGTLAHNTVSLGGHDQMLKGPRFIWLYWSQALQTDWKETDDLLEFAGSIRAFGQLGRNIVHRRRVRKYKNRPIWKIEDEVIHRTGLPLWQVWNISEDFESLGFRIRATDENGSELEPVRRKAWYSGRYGEKEPSAAILFQTHTATIHTEIQRT